MLDKEQIDAMADDRRPCATDVFLVALFEEFDNLYDRDEAIQDWLHGDWNAAFIGFSAAARAKIGGAQ